MFRTIYSCFTSFRSVTKNMPRRNSLLRPKSKTKVGALVDGIQSMKLEGLGDKLTFEQLLDLELMRTELFEKAHDFDQFKIAHSFVGTILPCLLTSPLSWAMAFMYILLRCLLRYELVHLGDDLPAINSIVTSIVGGFMSFFLVFFVSQAYNRFMAQYNHSKNIIKCITRTALMSRSSLPYAEALRLIRYLNAAHVVGYVALSKTYSMENLFTPMIARYHLLNETEIERLKAIGLDSGPGALREMITWALDIVYRIYDDQNSYYDDANRIPFEEWKFASHPRRVDFISLQMMINNIIEFNGNFSDLFNFQEQTFPFSYMHLLVLINACYLILITYTIATYMPEGNTLFPDCLGAFILFCNLIFVTGMREIGGHMIDPYGSDVTDLPIISYIQTAVKSSLEILHGQRLGPSDLETELQIHARRPKLRPAFLREPTLHMPSPMKEIINDDQQGNTSYTTNSKEDNDLSNDVESGIIRNAEIAIRYDKTL